MRFTMEFLTGGYYDEYNGITFEGIEIDKCWNGWMCPVFDKKTADEIAKTINVHSEDFGYMEFFDSDSGGYYSVSESGDEIERFDAMIVNGKMYYPIGAGSWMWEASE